MEVLHGLVNSCRESGEVLFGSPDQLRGTSADTPEQDLTILLMVFDLHNKMKGPTVTRVLNHVEGLRETTKTFLRAYKKLTDYIMNKKSTYLKGRLKDEELVWRSQCYNELEAILENKADEVHNN